MSQQSKHIQESNTTNIINININNININNEQIPTFEKKF